MWENLFYAFALIATFRKILSVPTFVFVDSRFVFTFLVKNIVLVWRSNALEDTFYQNYFMIFEKFYLYEMLPYNFNNSIYITLCGVCEL